MHRIGKKYILQAIPDSDIARTFLYLLRHLRFTLPSTNLLIQTKFFYFLYFNLLLQHTIQIKEKDRYMCFHSCRWNPETKTAVSTEGKYKPKLIWANSSPCKFSINCDQRLRLSTFWWLLRANSWQDIVFIPINILLATWPQQTSSEYGKKILNLRGKIITTSFTQWRREIRHYQRHQCTLD